MEVLKRLEPSSRKGMRAAPYALGGLSFLGFLGGLGLGLAQGLDDCGPNTLNGIVIRRELAPCRERVTLLLRFARVAGSGNGLVSARVGGGFRGLDKAERHELDPEFVAVGTDCVLSVSNGSDFSRIQHGILFFYGLVQNGGDTPCNLLYVSDTTTTGEGVGPHRAGRSM